MSGMGRSSDKLTCTPEWVGASSNLVKIITKYLKKKLFSPSNFTYLNVIAS